jgi:hypothetical protein
MSGWTEADGFTAIQPRSVVLDLPEQLPRFLQLDLAGGGVQGAPDGVAP